MMRVILLVFLLMSLPLISFSSAEDPKPSSKYTPDCVGEVYDKLWNMAGDRQELTMREMRRLGIAIECYAIDEDMFPSPSDGLTTLDFLNDYLSPTYILEIYTEDTWGSEYLYWSDGYHYVFVSYGSDRTPDLDYESAFALSWDMIKQTICLGRNTDPEGDIVFTEGNHCRWYKLEED